MRDYLVLVGADAAPRPAPIPATGLLIAQMLDYLSLVLSADEQWPTGALIKVPDLRSAGTLSLPVISAAEFRDRLSAVASILGALNAPEVAPEVVARAPYNGKQPGSLARLDSWLQGRLTDDLQRGRVGEAIRDLRDVVRLRVEGQHAGARLQQDAPRSRLRLGLPEVIFDWAEAWVLVQGRIAEALDVIRMEVRMARTQP